MPVKPAIPKVNGRCSETRGNTPHDIARLEWLQRGRQDGCAEGQRTIAQDLRQGRLLKPYRPSKLIGEETLRLVLRPVSAESDPGTGTVRLRVILREIPDRVSYFRRLTRRRWVKLMGEHRHGQAWKGQTLVSVGEGESGFRSLSGVEAKGTPVAGH